MGRFLVGFLVGAALSATAVIVFTPKSGEETRQGMKDHFNAAVEEGRQAALQHEQAAWDEFHRQLKEQRMPSVGMKGLERRTDRRR